MQGQKPTYFKVNRLKIFAFWILFWLLQSVLMSGGEHLDFYLLKNIAIVSLQALVVYTNLYLLFPYLFEKRRYFLYTLATLVLVYLIFSLSFFFIELVFSIRYTMPSNNRGIQFSTDFWKVLSGSSFYSLALLCSALYRLWVINQDMEKENKKIKNEHTGETLYIKEGNTSHIINSDNILFVKGLREYVVWTTDQKKIISLESLKNIESRLHGKGFKRVHKSYIINTKKIDSLSSHTITIGSQEIPIGRKYRENIVDFHNARG